MPISLADCLLQPSGDPAKRRSQERESGALEHGQHGQDLVTVDGLSPPVDRQHAVAVSVEGIGTLANKVIKRG